MKKRFHDIELSAVLTFVSILFLFCTAISVILVAPYFTETAWRTPTNSYQVQMYEIADPNFYISSTGSGQLQARELVHHLKAKESLLAFEENSQLRILAPEELQKYITKDGDSILKLTSRLLMLRVPLEDSDFGKEAKKLKQQLQEENGNLRTAIEVLELYVPEGSTAFARASTDGILENWVDKRFEIIDPPELVHYNNAPGVIYVANPLEYRVTHYKVGQSTYWRYDPNGQPIKTLEELMAHPLNFMSRQQLIYTGEHLYAIEGCWYCHTDQTRTLVQDVVLNGSDSYPAPPSSPNEYIYQRITFPGTRRIGPDLSRVGIKRPSRDWHKGHFWSPKTASEGSVMPAFRHFFDFDPSGTGANQIGIPNYQFEAMFQYLMTKGTRITPPTEAWWTGKDPIKTLEIIEGKRELP